MGSNINLTARPGCFQYQATLTVLARRVNRVLYLAFIIRGLMSSVGTPAGAKSLLMRYPISFKIEGRELSPPLILSPMAGVTDSPFRRVAKNAAGWA